MNSDVRILEQPTDLLKGWHRRVRRNQLAHYRCADMLINRSRFWSAAAAALSASIGVLILIAARYDAPVWLHLITGGLSIVAAAITTVNASKKPSEVAAQHHAGGAAYGAAVRKIEEALVLPPKTEDEMRALIKGLRESLDAIPTTVPVIPRHIWPQIEGELTPELGVQAQLTVPADVPASGPSALRQGRG